MSEKRRDNKNRILRTGESQRKDGRYAYKYIDTFGKPQFVYSWKLVPTDKTPAGKRDDIALREKEKEIQKDLDDARKKDAPHAVVHTASRTDMRHQPLFLFRLPADPQMVLTYSTTLML